jgi:multisubunit Na+/H+ antiporter MnhC subunit
MLVWGVSMNWSQIADPNNTVLWTTAIVVLVAPTAFAGLMFLLAARTQEVQELTAEKASA